MNTEIPNTDPTSGSTPTPAVVPPVTDTPVPDAPALDANIAPELPKVEASEPAAPAPIPAPAAPIPEAPVAPEAPSEPAPAAPEAAPVGFNAPAEPVDPAIINENSESFTASSVAPEVPASDISTPPAMPEQNIQPAPAEPAPKKGKGGLIAIIIVVVVALLGVGGWFLVTKVLITPEKVYQTVLAEFLNDAKDETKNNKFVSMVLDANKPFTINGNLSIDSDVPELETLKNLKLDFSVGADYKNNKLMLSGNLKDATSSLGGAMYLSDGKAYLDLEELLGAIVYFTGFEDIDFSEFEVTVNEEDVLALYDTLNNALLAALEQGDLTKESTKIKVDGKDVSVTDNIYTIDSKNAEKVVKAFLETIKKDTKAVQTLADLLGVEKDDVTAMLDDLINSEFSSDESAKSVIHVYTGGLMGDTLYGIDIIDGSDKLVESRINGEDSTTVINLDSEANMKIVVKGNKTTITLNESGEVFATINIVETENSITIDAVMDTTTINISLTTKEISGGFNETLVIGANDSDLEMNLTVTLSLDCLQSMYEEPDFSKAVNGDELTDEQFEAMMMQLQSKLESNTVVQTVSAYLDMILSSIEIGYGDDYDYDYDDDYDYDFSLSDFFWAADDAISYEDDLDTDKTICFSAKYLIDKNYLSTDYEDYTGSVLYDDFDYYVWLSDGVEGYENVDYYGSEPTKKSLTSASNNCDGKGEIYCGDSGTCK